jgi:general secretion pathway protein K
MTCNCPHLTSAKSASSARQFGFAVVMVLVIIAVLALLMSALMARNGQLLQRSMGKLHQYQAQAYLVGSEAWAQQILQDDLLQSDNDTLTETWAFPVPMVAVKGGEVSGYMIDLSGRFNINNLVVDDEPDPIWVAVFRALLDRAGASPDLVWSVVDWLDADSEAHNGGLEDAIYYTAEQPYRVANGQLLDISELNLIKGFSKELVGQLRPYLSALPENVKINVNTAPEPVLEAIVNVWDKPNWDASSLRQERPWLKLEDSPLSAGGADENPEQPDKLYAGNMENYLSVKSDFFLLDASARVSEQYSRVQVTLGRTNNKVMVLSRIWLPGN